jgi:hypothetical protein
MAMENLAQASDSMFERNAAIIASRKQEVQIFSDGFVYVGYLCGLDENWVQLYGHEENDKDNFVTMWRFLLINKKNISALGPNGNGLHDIDPVTREFISKKIQMFSDVSDKFIKSKGIKKNDDRKEDI